MIINNNQCEYAVYSEETQATETQNDFLLDFDTVYKNQIGDDDNLNATDKNRHLNDDTVGWTTANGNMYLLKVKHTETAVDDKTLNLNSSGPFVESCCPVEHVLTLYCVITADKKYAYLTREEMEAFGSCQYAYIYSYTDRGEPYSYYQRISNKVEPPAEMGRPTETEIDSDINFLYKFGKSIVENSSGLSDLLNININGQSFISLLFTSGFLIYASWCIVKWILPL